MSSLSRGWALVLVASLAVNLFIAGFVAAKAARSDNSLPPVAEQPQAAQPSSPAPAAAVRRVVEQNKSLRPSMLAVRRANEAVSAALVADPFDPERLATALETLRTVTLDSQKALHGAMLETIAAMSPEQRRQFADATKRVHAERVFLGR